MEVVIGGRQSGRLTPPPAHIKSKQFTYDAWVSIEFDGWFGHEFDKDAPSMALPQSSRGFTINNYLGGSGPTLSVQISFAVSPDLARGAAIDHAVHWLESMECFYPGVLDDASNVEITYRVERERMRRYSPFSVD